jgi:hypothetical protein
MSDQHWTDADVFAELERLGLKLRVKWDYDELADLSYLDQECFADVDPSKVVSLVLAIEQQCSDCGSWHVVQCLGGVDFADHDPYFTGIASVSEAIEKGNDYQAICVRDLVREVLAERKKGN